ncbi:MAG: glycoside hydrolase family 65 protein [Lactovum sp.]
MNSSDWAITYNRLETGKKSYGQESLMTLGNGYLGWRGAPIWSEFSENHYPGLYLAGIFNKTKTEVAGHEVINEDMVNIPNPQLLRFFIDGKRVDFSDEFIVDRKSEINFYKGIQTDKYTVRVDRGFFSLKTTKYVDPLHFHCIGFEATVSATFAGKLVIESLIDASVENQNVERYRAFDSKEFEVTKILDNLVLAKTSESKINLAIAARTKVSGQPIHQEKNSSLDQLIERVHLSFGEAEKIRIEKVIVLATSHETENPELYVRKELEDLSLESIRRHSVDYWENIWREADIKIDSENEDLQLMIRMNIFHIRQAAQHHANQYLDTSVGSRALTGEGYRGHIFWDEIFVIPYYSANDPKTARDLLLYRLKRLEAAKKNAEFQHEKGAMFPWQSGLEGDEQSQFIHLNTVNNKWEPDYSRYQRHVNLAIVYNLFIYYQFTGDDSILNEGGLELLLETTKFWLNKVEIGENGRYHIDGVMGPDEYHEAYPKQKESGICDNAYTNLMLVWSLNWLFSLPKNPHINLTYWAEKTEFDNNLFEKAKKVSENLYLEIDEEGVIAQYAGYFYLKEVDFSRYKQIYGDTHRIDRLMKAEGISPDEYKVAKQADSLMAIYNLGEKEVKKLVEQLSYQLPENWLEINYDYYLKRTVHGSTISRPVFAAVSLALGKIGEAVELLTEAIGSDYYDIQGGTTAEGIHIGVMGETLKLIQNDFAGVSLEGGEFSIAPQMPGTWKRLSFSQKFRGVKIQIELTSQLISLRADKDIQIKVYGKEFMLEAGDLSVFAIKN